MADLDGDGNPDLLSGSWPGELFLFRGGPGRTFAPPEMLRDRHGEILAIGGGMAEQADGSLLIFGHAEFAEVDGKRVVKYHGQTLECTDARPIAITGSATSVNVVDWDGDGDFDLLVGDLYGAIHLVPNEGTPRKPAFGEPRPVLVGGEPLELGGDAGPCTADWDGDGDLDLIVGESSGAVTLFRAVGAENGWPVLGPAEPLLPPVEGNDDAQPGAGPTRGIRAKPCVADWNGDGRPDLLVGDYCASPRAAVETTPEESAACAKLEAEIAATYERYTTLVKRLAGGGFRDAEEREGVAAELAEVSEHLHALRARLPGEHVDHGWVWLYLRKPA